MPPISRNSYSALLRPDVYRVYMETGVERPLEYTSFLNVVDMPYNPIRDQQMAGMPTMPDKLEGERFATRQPLIGTAKERLAAARGMAVEFTFEAWDDELYGVFPEEASELRRSSNNRLEVDATEVLNEAFNTAFTGFTASESLCAISHTMLDGSTQANRPNPDIGFSQTYIQGALLRFHGMKDHNGLPRLMYPTTVVIAPDNIFAAREILGSSGAPYQPSNEINSLVQDDLKWMVSHYLSSSTAHFLLCAQGVHDLQIGIKNAPMFDSFDDPWTKNAVFTVYQRNTNGYYNLWQGVDGSTG